MLTPPWPPSAWIFAKHWPTRAMPSTSPKPSVLTSPSPWTPGERQQAQGSRRRQVPPPYGEMLGGERNIYSRSKTLQQWTPLKKRKLLPMCFLVTSVTINQPLKRDLGNTRGWSMDLPSWLPLVTVKLLLRRFGQQVLRLLLLCLRLLRQAGRSLAKTVRTTIAQSTAVSFTNVVDVQRCLIIMMTWVITWQRFIHSCATFATWIAWIIMEDSSTIMRFMQLDMFSIFLSTLCFCDDLNSDW